MGDFNSEWIAEQLTQNNVHGWASLHTSFEIGKNLNTYKDKRLDWVLVSNAFKLETYDVSPRALSDHLAIVATVSLVRTRPGRQ